MVKDLLDAVRSVFERRDVILKNRKEFCEHIGVYYGKISVLLQEVADGLKADNLSQAKLVELAATAEFILPVAGATSRLLDIEKLTAMLRRSYELAALKSASKGEREEGIQQIEFAAGVFGALADACPLHYNS